MCAASFADCSYLLACASAITGVETSKLCFAFWTACDCLVPFTVEGNIGVCLCAACEPAYDMWPFVGEYWFSVWISSESLSNLLLRCEHDKLPFC